jgi:hypothetical protein
MPYLASTDVRFVWFRFRFVIRLPTPQYFSHDSQTKDIKGIGILEV